jgi:YcaO-like protein with predicted kinase domain
MNADALLERLRPHLEPAGITRVANVTGLDQIGIPVVLVIRPNSRSLSVSQGKGVDLASAKVSAIMESMEQFHAEHVEKPLAFGSLRDRASRGRVADVRGLPRRSPEFDERAKILWITAKHLGSGEDVEVPFELVHLDLTEPLPPGSGFFALGSNGLASGVELDDAILHGALELVERDALALFYRLSPYEQALRRVRLDSVDDPICRALLDRFETAAIGVVLWEMTSDLGVPAFLCSIGERELDLLRRIGPARGYGCHLRRGTALRRALTEAAQSRLTRIAGSRDDIQAEDLAAIRAPEAIERQLAHVLQEPMARHDFTSIPDYPCGSSAEALNLLRERLSAQNFDDVLYVDLSRPEYPFAVARTIIVGLEGFPDAPDYVPGARARAASARSAFRAGTAP